MKKRVLSLLLALVMALSLLPVSALATTPLGTPTDLQWVGTALSWKVDGACQNSFKITVIKKGENGDSTNTFYVTAAPDEDGRFYDDTGLMSMAEEKTDAAPPAGNYAFTVQCHGGTEYSDGVVSQESPILEFVPATNRLPAPTNLRWEDFRAIADAPDFGGTESYFSRYQVMRLFSTTNDSQSAQDTRSYIVNYEEPLATLTGGAIARSGAGYYWFKVRTMSNDLTIYGNSEWTEVSATAYQVEDSSLIKTSLRAIIGQLEQYSEQWTQTDKAQYIRSELYSLKDKLRDAMAIDPEVVALVQRLEAVIGVPTVVDAAEAPAGMDVSGVSVAGAGLNYLQSGTTQLKLKIGKPAQEHVLNPALYNSSLSVQFSMDLEGVIAPQNLSAPVQVTLPVPAGISPGFLCVLHYPADGGEPEVMGPGMLDHIHEEGGKYYVTLYLSHFSDFVMTAAKETKPITEDMFTVDTQEMVYTGSAITKIVTGKDEEKELILDTDYTVAYQNNTDAGEATLTITGMGDYSGTLPYTFTITPKPVTITGAVVENKSYDGKTDAVVTSVTFDGAALALNTDYTATAAFADETAGEDKEVTVTVELKNGNYTLPDGGKSVKTSADITKAELELTAPVMMKTTAGYTREITLSSIPGLPGEEITNIELQPGSYTGLESPTLSADGKTLTLKTKEGAVAGGSDTVVIAGESTNYEGTLTLKVTYTDKTPVELAGIAVAGKVYDGDRAAYTGTLTITDPVENKSVAVADSAVTYQWFAAADRGTALPEAPANAGEYVLVVTVEGKMLPAISGGASESGNGGSGSVIPVDPDSLEDCYGILELPLTIAKATVTVTAKDVSYTIGKAAPVFEYTVTGLVSEEDWQTKPSAACGADLSARGSYPITVSGGALKSEVAGNYEPVKYVSGTLTVKAKSSGTPWIDYGSSGSGGSTGDPATPTEPAKPETPAETLPTTPVTERFDDIKEGSWYKDAVQYVCDKGMMNGMSTTSFAPAASTSRAMLVTILYRLEGEPEVESAVFPDVASTAYYAGPVAWAAANGVVNGFENGDFRPDGVITREQIVVILYRYAQFKGYDMTAGEKAVAFTDDGDISSYAKEAVEWAAGIGLVNGYQDGTFRPTGTAARAEVAAILMRFCEDVAGTSAEGSAEK